MDAMSNLLLSEENFNRLNGFSFEDTIKSALKMDKQQWIDIGKENSKIRRLCNTLVYWRKRLEEALTNKTLILTFFREGLDTYISLEEIIMEIKKIIPIEKITGYFKPRNKRFVGLDFDSIETKEMVEKALKKVGNSFIVNLNWVEVNRDIIVKFHWLPRSVSLTEIRNLLAKYSEIEEIWREETVISKDIKLQSGIIHAKIKLYQNFTINDIPHLTNIGSLQTLVTINGRIAMCLGCEKLGHIAMNCPWPFCRTCKKRMPKKHLCIVNKDKKSYAQAAQNTNVELEDMEVFSEDEGEQEENAVKLDGVNISAETKMVLESKVESVNYVVDKEVLDKNFPPLKLNVQNTYTNDDCANIDMQSVQDNSEGRASYNSGSKFNKCKSKMEEGVLDSTDVHVAKKNKRSKVDENLVKVTASKPIKTYGLSKSVSLQIPVLNKFDVLSENSEKWSDSDPFKESDVEIGNYASDT